MRLFIALEFPQDVKRKIAEGAEDLKRHCVSGNFSREENYHLTLAFIGETHPKNTGRLQKILDGLSFGEFDIEIGGLSCFRRDGGDIIYRKAAYPGELEALYDELHLRLAESGFEIRKQPFKAHITLAREARLAEGEKYSGIHTDRITFRAGAVSLMLSERRDGKLVYSCIYRVKAH